jgi:hypothetical protein
MPIRTALVTVACLICWSATFDAARVSPVLRASASSQRIQNARADAEDLTRLASDRDVLRFRRAGLLVPVPASTAAFYVHQVPAKLRYLRPWARLFLTRLSRQFHARFGTRLRITGLLRTVHYQARLTRRNVNAAAASGASRSSHLTGATLDISKRFMSAEHRSWMRSLLSELRDREVLYAIEEFGQPCFHVMVYRNYAEYVERLTS